MQKVTRSPTAQEKQKIRKTFFPIKVLVFVFALLLIGTTLERPGTARGEDVAQNGGSASQNAGLARFGAGTGSGGATTLAGLSAQNANLSFSARPEENDTISVTMVGDILLHTKVMENCRNDDGSYSFSSIFAGTKSVTSRADISLVNQEVIIGGAELGVSGYPRFNAPYEIADSLVEAGFNVICHATNHAVDKGKQGILNCLNYWSKNHPEISVIGLYGTKEDSEKIFIYEKNGMKIAVLNYTLHTNFLSLPADMKFAVNLLDEDKVRADLEKAKSLADFIIVCPHWGVEYSHEVSAAQRDWCKIFMEYGVGLVIGTHPHVIQPIEMMTDEATGKKMLVYYSLGNFVNWTSNTGKNCASQFVGGLADVKLAKADDGSVFVAEYSVKPTVCHVSTEKNGITVYFLASYSRQKAEKNAIKKQDSSFSYEYCANLVKRVWPQFAE
jgi:poly-gamma-glutamate synthesis protein (capsule biosynthesis protein)